MPADLAPAPRVTPKSASRLVAVYAARWGLTGRPPPAADWTFTVSVVPGLTHGGQPAWAVVDPRVNRVASPDVLPGGSAHVQIRDIDATPIPGFDGDALLELRVTVAHEMGHPVVAEALAMHGAMNVPAEEHIVETAAQAIVRSEGTADARVMARAVRGAVPSALRARVAASAGQRARGGQMDPDLVKQALDALEAGDGAKCAELLKGLIASAASGAPAHAEPDADDMAKVAPAPAPGGTDGGGYPAPADDARRAKGADMDQDKARARKAADEAEKAAAETKRALEIIRPAAKAQVVTSLRARTGRSDLVAAEEAIMAAPDLATAEMLASFTEKLMGGGSGAERARSGIEHEANPGQGSGPKLLTPEALLAEGHSPSWIKGYQNTAKLGHEHAAAYLEQGRIGLRARTGKTQNGASS